MGGGQSYSASNLAGYNTISHAPTGLGQGFGGHIVGHGLAAGTGGVALVGGHGLIGAGAAGHGVFSGAGAGHGVYSGGQGDIHDNERVSTDFSIFIHMTTLRDFRLIRNTNSIMVWPILILVIRKLNTKSVMGM